MLKRSPVKEQQERLVKGKLFPSSQEDGISGLGADLTLQLMTWNIPAMNDCLRGQPQAVLKR